MKTDPSLADSFLTGLPYRSSLQIFHDFKDFLNSIPPCRFSIDLPSSLVVGVARLFHPLVQRGCEEFPPGA